MKLSNSDKEYLLSIKPEDMTFSFLVGLIGDTRNDELPNKPLKKSKFNPTDTFTLTPADYFVKTNTETTVGRFIFNKYLIERCGFQKILGYVNIPLTKGAYGGIEKKLTNALLNDQITTDDYTKWIDYRDTLGFQLNSVITTSFTRNSITLPADVLKKKKELFTKYKKELKNNDIPTSEKIIGELMNDVKKDLAKDPGLDLYVSGARGGLGNYQNMNIMKGAYKDIVTGEYKVLSSAFMDGITKEDISPFGTSVVTGSYPKAVGTAESGYMSKKLLAAMQTEVIDEDVNSDCGTTKTIDITITNGNKNNYLYRYILEGSKLVELNDSNIDKYVGKTVKLRTPMYCKSDKICNKCAGNFIYKLGDVNVGLQCSKIATTLTQLGMKKFHVSNISTTKIDIDDLLI